MRNASTSRTGEDQAAQRPGGHDVRDGRLAEEDRHLAEELAAAQPGALRAVDDDGRLAIEDDVEPGAGEALAEDPLALPEDGLLEGVDDALELRRGQVGEEREAGDRIHEFLSAGHEGLRFDGASGARRAMVASCQTCAVDARRACGAAWRQGHPRDGIRRTA